MIAKLGKTAYLLVLMLVVLPVIVIAGLLSVAIACAESIEEVWQ